MAIGYRQIRPIGRTEYRILKALLRFSRETCKLNEFYVKNSPISKRRIERLFPQVCRRDEIGKLPCTIGKGQKNTGSKMKSLHKICVAFLRTLDAGFIFPCS